VLTDISILLFMTCCDSLIEEQSLAQNYSETGKVKYIHFRHNVAKMAMKVTRNDVIKWSTYLRVSCLL